MIGDKWLLRAIHKIRTDDLLITNAGQHPPDMILSKLLIDQGFLRC